MSKTMTELIQLTEKWGEERNFYSENGTTPEHQFVKLIEELGEMSGNIARGRSPKDDIGDQMVVLTHIARLCKKSLINSEFDLNVETDEINQLSIQKHVLYLTLEYGNLGHGISNKQHKNQLKQTYTIEFFIAISVRRLKRIAAIYNLTLEECFEHSYDEIKDRKGKMVNSTFVKESDL